MRYLRLEVKRSLTLGLAKATPKPRLRDTKRKPEPHDAEYNSRSSKQEIHHTQLQPNQRHGGYERRLKGANKRNDKDAWEVYNRAYLDERVSERAAASSFDSCDDAKHQHKESLNDHKHASEQNHRAAVASAHVVTKTKVNWPHGINVAEGADRQLGYSDDCVLLHRNYWISK